MDEKQFFLRNFVMDDGSKDRSWEVISQLSQENPQMSGLAVCAKLW
jgi:hypothetical protein